MMKWFAPTHYRTYMRQIIWILLISLLAGLLLKEQSTNAQFPRVTPTEPTLEETATPTPDHRAIVPREEAIIRQGPGHSHLPVNRLNWQDEIEILERNRPGTWVYIRVTRGGGTPWEGWVLTGYLDLDETVRLSEVPVNVSVADANASTINSRSQSRLYAVPVISVVSDAMRDVYERGQQIGNRSNSITKIGDSLSASRIYLIPMSRGDHQLGPYDFLDETIDFFGASMAEIGVASRIGLSSIAVFDPVWADPQLCEPNETPLACEYRRKKPSIAFILFGPNDVRAMDEERYETQMRLIVEESMNQGVIPVLSTFSADPDEAFWWQSINFNLVLLDIAEEYEVPLINLWAAARPLPNYGLDRDRIHLKHSGYENLHFVEGQEAYYGVSLQNLLSLCMLDELRRTLGMR